ncbi:nucleoside phosphorylase domain-containing protein [Aspergillus germanicus]
MPGMGKGSAAGVASSLLVSYPGVKLALVVGICGGAPPPPKYQEVFLGDVIISDSVIKYDFGRQYPGGFQRKTGVKDTLGRPGREIRALLNGLRAENARRELQDQAQQYLHTLQQTGIKWIHPGVDDILFKACYLHKHYSNAFAGCSCFGSDSPDQICEEALGRDCNDLDCDHGQHVRCREALEAAPTSIYIGPVASADTVMKSGQHRDEIVKKEKVIGFEMEGAGVWDNVPCVIIKGVCDYADSHKSKVWQAYSAATGASVAKAFLEYWMPAKHKDTSRRRHVMIPFSRNPHFVGRQDEIQQLDDLITMPDGPRKLAIAGLGGVGKTQIALELAYRIRDREPECSIFWIPCTSYEAVEQAFMTIAQLVGLQDVEPAEVKERLRTYFSQSSKKWIMIFDNADDMDMWIKGSPTTPPLKKIIPRSENGHVLFTSRNWQLALKLVGSNVVSVPDVDPKTGKEIFWKLLM